MITLDSAPARIAAMIERLGRLVRAREAATLAPAQWEALRFLARVNSFSRQPGVVANWLVTTRGTASQTLIALTRKGLVRKADHPRDRRATVLEVTQAGHALLAQDPAQELIQAIAKLPPLHSAGLSQSLARILGDLVPVNETPLPAPCRDCRHQQWTANGGARHCAHFGVAVSDDDAERACYAHLPRG